MKLKVIGGTPPGGSNALCATYSHAHILKGDDLRDRVLCDETPFGFPEIRLRVIECSKYEDKRLPSLKDMRMIAWKIESRNRGPVGFIGERKAEIVVVPPEKWPIPTEGKPDGE